STSLVVRSEALKARTVLLAACAGVTALFSYAVVNRADDKPKNKPMFVPSGKVCNLTPNEAVEAMTLAEGFKATLFAGEPDVRQPNAFFIDDRGRLCVCENYTYTKTGWQDDDRDRI